MKIRAGLESQCDRQVLPGKIQPQRTTTAAGKGFAMTAETRFEYLTSEQTEILRAIKRMETAFELAGDNDFSKRIKGLLELRSLEHAYDGIAEHCHSEERIVESTFRHYASAAEYSQIVAGTRNFCGCFTTSARSWNSLQRIPRPALYLWARSWLAGYGSTSDLRRSCWSAPARPDLCPKKC